MDAYGTSVVNAMKLGLPIFGYRISEGMYGDDFLSTSMADLQEKVSDFLANGPDETVLAERASFISSKMSINACRDRLLATINGERIPVPYDYDTENMDLTFHHQKWKENTDLFVPPIIKINKTL